MKKKTSQQLANEVVELLQRSINALDFELGNGKNVPKIVVVGDKTYEFKALGKTWTMTLEPKE